MWWNDYTDTQPKFVKAWNSRKKTERQPLTDEIERMAWNYHYSYLYNQMIYEWSEGYGKLEIITKEYPPTRYWLPKLVETDNKKPVTADILKQRSRIDHPYMTAAVDLFSNPFEHTVGLPEDNEPTIYRKEFEQRIKEFKTESETEATQLALF